MHVWRISLTQPTEASSLWATLSVEEQTRAARLVREELRSRYVIAHGWARKILARYLGLLPGEIRYEYGDYGKPRIQPTGSSARVDFNLTHSGDIALIAVTPGTQVGIDIEAHNRKTDFLELAARTFSVAEREALAALADDETLLTAGFFACWTRKEAYLKATGHGISGGLEHFDVSLTPGQPARLLRDERDPGATNRWNMREITVSPGYSAAVVVEAPLRETVLLEARG